MTAADLAAAVEDTRTLKRLQETPDPPEALATIPSLTLADLPRHDKPIPLEQGRVRDTPVLYHDLATSGIVYLDVAFDLHRLPAELLPLVELFARALLETGAGKEDFVALSQRIGRATGGIGTRQFVSATRTPGHERRTVAPPRQGGAGEDRRAAGDPARCACSRRGSTIASVSVSWCSRKRPGVRPS